MLDFLTQNYKTVFARVCYGCPAGRWTALLNCPWVCEVGVQTSHTYTAYRLFERLDMCCAATIRCQGRTLWTTALFFHFFLAVEDSTVLLDSSFLPVLFKSTTFCPNTIQKKSMCPLSHAPQVTSGRGALYPTHLLWGSLALYIDQKTETSQHVDH